MSATTKKILKITAFCLLFIILIAALFFGATTLRYYWHRPVAVHGDSMLPTIAEDSLHYCNTRAKPDFYDIALFYYVPQWDVVPTADFYTANAFWRSMPIWGLKIAESTGGDYEIYVKRVVGLGGDTIELRAETIDEVHFVFLYRNGQKVNENIVMLNATDLNEATIAYAERLYAEKGAESTQGVRPTEPYTVPEGYLYVLGDNRDDSSDSRKFGPVPAAYFLGVLR